MKRIYVFEEDVNPNERITVWRDGLIIYEFVIPNVNKAKIHFEVIMDEGS